MGGERVAASIFGARGIGKMAAIRCPQCGVCAYDKASELFGLAHLVVRDGDCSYFVAAKEYVFKCEYVDGRRDGLFCATDHSCPNLKEAITLGWRLIASAEH